MIHLDANATAPMRDEVWAAMRSCHEAGVGNPSSAHALGRRARRLLDEARERIAARLGAFPDEVIFTSGATEANNLAILGLSQPFRCRIVLGGFEHPCVLEPAKKLTEQEYQLEGIPLDSDGRVSSHRVEQLAQIPTVRLLSWMLVNHETGAIQPHADGEIAKRLPERVAFHTDAAQAAGKIPIHFHKGGWTAMTISGHKFGGPPGVGALLLRRGRQLPPIMYGGHQQKGRRPGTEAVALAVGMATALDVAGERMAEESAYVTRLRDRFAEIILNEADPAIPNTTTAVSTPYCFNVSFVGCRAELLLMKLDMSGVACSTGSACSSGSLLPSPTLQCMGLPEERLRSAMRFSFGIHLTPADIEEAALRVVRAVKELRADNPDSIVLG